MVGRRDRGRSRERMKGEYKGNSEVCVYGRGMGGD